MQNFEIILGAVCVVVNLIQLYFAAFNFFLKIMLAKPEPQDNNFMRCKHMAMAVRMIMIFLLICKNQVAIFTEKVILKATQNN